MDTIPFEQRWTERREHRIPARELFVPTDHTVDLIPVSAAKQFVISHHYSASFPSCVAAAGLFAGRHLAGVAVFGNPSNEQVVRAWTDLGPRDGLELNRFVLTPEIGYNGESWFLRRAFGLLSGEKPNVRAIISYSDPVRRHDAQGKVTLVGHIGTIYQSSNAVFAGRATGRIKTLAPDGTVVDGRALSKITTDDQGRDYAIRSLVERGARPPRDGEDLRLWLRQALAGYFQFRHPGNLTYLFGLDRETTRRLKARGQQPYPKGEVIEEARDLAYVPRRVPSQRCVRTGAVKIG